MPAEPASGDRRVSMPTWRRWSGGLGQAYPAAGEIRCPGAVRIPCTSAKRSGNAAGMGCIDLGYSFMKGLNDESSEGIIGRV